MFIPDIVISRKIYPLSEFCPLVGRTECVKLSSDLYFNKVLKISTFSVQTGTATSSPLYFVRRLIDKYFAVVGQ